MSLVVREQMRQSIVPVPMPRRAVPEAGVTLLEVVIGAAFLAVLSVAAIGLLGRSVDSLGDLRADASLWTRHRLALSGMIAEIEGADSTDTSFAVSASQVRFRTVTGVQSSGTRTYGDTVTYAIEGPVQTTGGVQAYQLVRTLRDTTYTTTIGRTVLLSDLTSTTDAGAPSTFTYTAPYLQVRLVALTPSPSRAGEWLLAGICERVRLRY